MNELSITMKRDGISYSLHFHGLQLLVIDWSFCFMTSTLVLHPLKEDEGGEDGVQLFSYFLFIAQSLIESSEPGHEVL